MPRKKTKEQVIIELTERNLNHPPIYPVDDDFAYVSTNHKIDWRCEHGHVFNTIFKHVLKGHGCKKCGMKRSGVKNAKSTELLIERLEARNKRTPDKQVRIKDITEYTGMTKKITWICAENHEWSAAPKTVLQRDTYCRKCADKENADKQRFTTLDIVARIKEHNNHHPNKEVSIVDIGDYSTNKSKILFRCMNGHEWSSPLGFIIDSHCGCPICAKAGFSLKAIAWLDGISKSDDSNIQHALNGGEYSISNSNYKADGYCEETNTVYEFHGDEFHGNPDMFNPGDICGLTYRSYGEMYVDTIKREEFIKSQGYNLVTIWEHDYDALMQCKDQINQIYKFLEGYDCVVSINTEYDLFLEDYDVAINYISLRLHTHNILGDVNFHKKQHSKASSTGIRLITIFSHEWSYNKAKVRDTLRYLVGHAEKGAYGRKSTIREIAWSISKPFLEKYHLLNSGTPATFSLGAYDGKRLIGVMTFGKPTREQGVVDYYEMTRFVTDKATHPGLATKMFKHATKLYKFKEVVAFVDKRWFSGTFKLLTGFEVVSETKPTMWYTDGRKLYNRRFMSRQRLLEELNQPSDTTKDSMMLALGYRTIYDCGKLKLRWTSE